MAKVHERTVEFALTMNAAADTVAVTAVNYYRDDAQLAASAPFALKFDTTSAQTSPADILFGELMPPPTRVRFTFSAF
jgi:hypothetical protein